MINPEQYAERLGIDLYTEYSADQAASLCRIGVNAIRAAKKNGELDYLEVGETRYKFLGVDLIRWKIRKRVIVSESTTSPKTDKATGVELGTTNRPDSDGVQALALATFSRQKQI